MIKNQQLTKHACRQKGARTFHKTLSFNELHFTQILNKLKGVTSFRVSLKF